MTLTMTPPEATNPKVTTEHQAKLAYVYVRQSSPGQVMRHPESTDLQYRLVERAVQLGWPRERIKTIDEDLGKSGASADQRTGFQYLIAEISLGRVGLVVSMDASRFARNNRDWHQLLELCSLFGALIADSECLYDPNTYHDRLLLGLSGMMSEAELHHLKLRLQAGERHKAERGELRQALPVGLVWPRGGEPMLNPDEEVQARLRLIFQKFRELGSAKAVVRYLRQHHLLIPTRPLRGPAPHETVWQPAQSSTVLTILKNPAYAGAYVHGRSTHVASRRKPGRPHTGIVHLPMDKWPIVLQNRYPAYLSWEEFLAIQARLQQNQSRYQEGKPGVARKGQALLQGIVICGRCGARMRLQYSGDHGQFPVYTCVQAQRDAGLPRCQEVRALGLDAEVERLLLAALAPDKIPIALAALAQLERENADLRKQWQLRLERAAYETERVRRQYDAVEPENRLVARALERQWEEKLRAKEQITREYEDWLKQHRLEVTAEDQREMLALGEDLPKVWHDPSTTPQDRKRILRLIVKTVIVDQKRARGKVWFQINWQAGAVSEHWLVRRVRGYAEHANVDGLEKRVRELHAEQKMDREIAAILNAEGYQTAHGTDFRGELVWLLRKQWKLRAVKEHGPHPERWDDGSYSVEGAAAVLGVYIGTIYQWLRKGRIQGHQLGKGLPWHIPLTEEQVASFRSAIRRGKQSKGEVS